MPVDQCPSGGHLCDRVDARSPLAIRNRRQSSVAEDIELERQQLHEGWKQRLERADYEAALARRRYEAVDPDTLNGIMVEILPL